MILRIIARENRLATLAAGTVPALPRSACWIVTQRCKPGHHMWTVEVPEVLREAQGHHRSATVSACVKRCSRDDINPQLSCQRKVVAKLRDGWPLCACGQRPRPPSDTEAESVDAEVSADPASDSEPGEFESESEASVASVAPALADLADREGSLLLDAVSGCAHQSVWCSELESWVLACRPSLQLGKQYEHWTCFPCFHGVRSCGHSGCWSSC